MSEEQKMSTNVFYLDGNGKAKYNSKCLHCKEKCKQSFRVKEVFCPHYNPRGKSA